MSTVNAKRMAMFIQVVLPMTEDERAVASEVLAAMRFPDVSTAPAPVPKPKPVLSNKSRVWDLPCVLCDKVCLNAHGLKVHMGRTHKTKELFPKTGR